MTASTKALVLGLIGAALGAVVGYFGFFWMARQGFYSPILPGAFLGLGAGLLAQQRSVLLAVICGIAALLHGLFVEFRFRGDDSISDFISHVQTLSPVTLIMIGLGSFFGYRFALGRYKEKTTNPAPK